VNTLIIEKMWPWAAAVAVATVWVQFGKPFPASPEGLFGTAATVASVFASFLGVSKAIILTIKDTQTYKFLERAKKTDDLFGYLRTGIYASVAFATLSILGFFINHESMIGEYHWYGIFCFLWVMIGMLALFSYIRITHILFRLLKQPEVTA
jgi:hypothetical protein